MNNYGKESYTLDYETRPKSRQFLQYLSPDPSNIDFYYMGLAYTTVKKWFSNPDNVKDRTGKEKFLGTLLGKQSDERSVRVIWYAVEDATDGRILFTRLNKGKIALTNAELIKALFLSSGSFKGDPEDAARKKLQISHVWDEEVCVGVSCSFLEKKDSEA